MAKGRKFPNFFQADEPQRLMAAADRERDRLIILCGMACGMRVGEITKLRVEDIDFRYRMIRIVQSKGGKDRTVPLPKVLQGPLRGWIGKRQAGYVFPSPQGQDRRLTARAVQKMMRRLAVKAKLTNATAPRRANPHKLRHFFGTQLLRTGSDIVEVQTLMGHSQLSSTSVYLHADPARLISAVDRLFE